MSAARHGLQDLADAITGRHFDAYLWTLSSVRLPTLSLGLKEVSAYLGFRPSTDVADGLDAITLYRTWLTSKDETIRTKLTEYNRDDRDALALIVSRFRDLAPAMRRQV
jgi:predicted RecB family nuclease